MEIVPTLRHHPQHLRIFILAQTDRTSCVNITGIHRSRSIFTELELWVRIYNGLVKPHDGVFVVVVFGNENNPGKVDSIGSGGNGGVGRESTRGRRRRGGRAATDVGSEEDGREENEETEGYGDGIAEA
ncbi:hypothetical protein ES332_A08G152300v1 [Gossypium tomentosum]|uniref:Uncharacterized protein n=1 Tax=Gossypium tomentosum TaxID=34277 RepID=A0A5D2PFT9_GOSTO|nr:hypothetical protein ES332_A08G152300v1 [Gossypium tomentosum]